MTRSVSPSPRSRPRARTRSWSRCRARRIPEQVVNDLIAPAQLTFINFERNVVNPQGTTDLYAAVTQATKTTPDQVRGKPTYYAFKDKQLVVPAAQDMASLKDSFPGNEIPPGVEVLKVPRGLFLAYEESPKLQTRDAGVQKTWYIFQNNPGLTGADVTEARSTIQTGGLGSRDRIVTLQFTGAGQNKFADITRQLATDGQLKGALQHFAIILDGKIVSNPSVDYQQYPTGISGDNGAEINGTFSQGEADTLAKQINSGALPIELKVISQKQVSATLGKQSLHQGLVAGLVGLVLVMLFLIAYYRFLGIVAALALIVYAILLYAVVVLLPITMTLPGIAGIILTIGVASDANVVIFERVREEARAGKPPRAAILAGYKKGIGAIIDANVVTFATALILFLFATAGVKGFAFTLGVGVLLSLFTAVVATRAAFGVLADTRFLRDNRFMGLDQKEIHWKLDFVGKWKLWLAISIVPLIIGTVWIGIHGLNLGLDFESGTRITTAFKTQPSEDSVRALFSDLGYKDAKVQSTSETIDGKTVRGFQMQTKTLQPAERTELQRALDAKFGIQQETFQLDSVGPTFGRQIIRNAIWAILLSFAVIVIYLSIRFEYKLAIPALISVIHDVWLSIAIYSFTGREVTSATVAALLTILGYSLYDVVIVFDRIRENVPIMRKCDVPRGGQHLGPRDADPIDHHVGPDADPHHGAVLLRWRHPEGLRLRPARRNPLRWSVVDRHRGAAGGHLEGTRTREQAARGQGRASCRRDLVGLRRGRSRHARARRGGPRPGAADRGRAWRRGTRRGRIQRAGAAWSCAPVRPCPRTGTSAAPGTDVAVVPEPDPEVEPEPDVDADGATTEVPVDGEAPTNGAAEPAPAAPAPRSRANPDRVRRHRDVQKKRKR